MYHLITASEWQKSWLLPNIACYFGYATWTEQGCILLITGHLTVTNGTHAKHFHSESISWLTDTQSFELLIRKPDLWNTYPRFQIKLHREIGSFAQGYFHVLALFIGKTIKKTLPTCPTPLWLGSFLMQCGHVMWAWLRCRVSQWSMATDWQQLRLTHYSSPGTGNVGVIKGKYPLHWQGRQHWPFFCLTFLVQVCVSICMWQASRRLWTCLCGNSLYFFNNAKDIHVSSRLYRFCVYFCI